jgi:hypothetical protein
MPAMDSKSARRSAQPAKARPSRPKAGLARREGRVTARREARTVDRPASALARARSLLPLAGFLAACLLPLLLPADWFHSRLWKGYYTMLLRSAPAASREPAPGTRPEFPGPAVSRRTARVSFNTFGGLASVRVADLARRLDSADPRLDPFLRGVEAYFRGDAGELVYARSPRGPLLSGLGGLGTDRQVLELDPVAAMIRLLLLAGAALLVLLPARVPNVPRWLLGLGLLPWALGISTGDLRDLLSFLLLFPFWVRAMVWAAARQAGSAQEAGAKSGRKSAGKRRKARQRTAGKRRKRRGPAWLPAALDTAAAALAALMARAREAVLSAPVPAALALLGAVVFFLAAPGARHLPGALSALAADLCLLALLPAARRWERSRRAHPLFRALPILGTLRGKTGRRRQRLSVPALVMPAALAVLALVCAAALGLAARRRDLQVPRLEPASGPGLSWEALAALPLSAGPQELPNLADFVTHSAYQQSLAFQRPYRFPAPGERVYISAYAEAGTRYLQSRRVALRFAESWLARTLASAPPGSVERLLVDQGRAGTVRRVGESQLARELDPWPRAAAVALFLLACLTATIRSATRTFAL